tara:strand:- start:6603 stop:7268 length:666 start_codon:yes stop_codon:yes gene_type:complete
MDTATDTPSPADASPEHAFSEAEFREHLLNYLCVLSCKFIGDDISYVRYMQKQAAAQNEHAVAGLKALSFVDGIHRAIELCIQYFAATGNARIVQVRLHAHTCQHSLTPTSTETPACTNTKHALSNFTQTKVCNAIRQLDLPPASHSQLWSLCALTGVNTNRALLIERAEQPPLAVDAQFTPFATMLWLVTHIDAVEYNRTMQFVNATPGISPLSTLVNPY